MARILNLDVAEFTMPELLQELHRGAVYTPNIDHLVKCQTDREFYEAYAQAEYIICDSRIVYWLSKLSKGHIPCPIPGSSFFRDFYNYHGNDESCRIFMLGSSGKVAEEAGRRINESVGRKMVVAAYSPLYDFGKDEEENGKIIGMVNSSGATVLAVCCGAPKSEIWIARYRKEMPGIRIFMSLGATIDFESGMKKRAPELMRRIGLEWFYRFIQEPKRMYRRYFIEDMKFFVYYARQLWGSYTSPF